MFWDENIGCHFNLMQYKLKHQFWSICELPIKFKCWFRTFCLKDIETRKVIKILLQQNSAIKWLVEVRRRPSSDAAQLRNKFSVELVYRVTLRSLLCTTTRSRILENAVFGLKEYVSSEMTFSLQTRYVYISADMHFWYTNWQL